MNTALKALIALLCLPLLVLGLSAMFNPSSVIEKFAVVPLDAHGWNTVRADIGGLLLGIALLMLMGLWRKNTTWFLAAALLSGIVAVGRLVGLAFDGADMAVVPPLVVELVIVGVMLTAHRKLLFP